MAPCPSNVNDIQRKDDTHSMREEVLCLAPPDRRQTHANWRRKPQYRGGDSAGMAEPHGWPLSLQGPQEPDIILRVLKALILADCSLYSTSRTRQSWHGHS
ncbi:hypothetical protein BZA77DRAFT_355468 [Pyronema omphalodes]|nr:hypothetical protein BZA77DRAFT_355468 [Pyronema omphalodes]